MAFTTAVKNSAVDNIASMGNWISLHTADPGTTGASEAGSVTRQQSVWGAAAAGIATGAEVTFAAIPAAGYTHWGCWSAVSAGTFRHGNVLTPAMTLGGAGTLKVTPRITFP
jgi:hypothetical protein